MEVSVSRFKEVFPTFKDVDYALCAEKLGAASLMVSERVCGSKTEYMTMLQAAHMLATEPTGENARLKDGRTRYEVELDRLTKIAAFGADRTS